MKKINLLKSVLLLFLMGFLLQECREESTAIENDNIKAKISYKTLKEIPEINPSLEKVKKQLKNSSKLMAERTANDFEIDEENILVLDLADNGKDISMVVNQSFSENDYSVINLSIVQHDGMENYFLVKYIPQDGKPFYNYSDFIGTVQIMDLNGTILATHSPSAKQQIQFEVGCWTYVATGCDCNGGSWEIAAYNHCGTGSGPHNGSTSGIGTGSTTGGTNGNGGSGSSSSTLSVPNIPSEDVVDQKRYKSFLTTINSSQYTFLAQHQEVNDMFFYYQKNNDFSTESKSFSIWGINFFLQNPDITGTQFQNWFIEGYSTQYQNELTTLNLTQLNELISLKREVDDFELYVQLPTFDPLNTPWIKKARELAQKLEDWAKDKSPVIKEYTRKAIDKSFIYSLNKTAISLYPDAGNLTEVQKQENFKINGKNGVAILLYEFANGLGSDSRNFPFDYDMTQQFLQGNITGDIRNDFLDKLAKNGLTYNQFVTNGNMIRGGYSFSPDHTTVTDSFNKHIKANWVQFFIGGANAEYYPTNENGWIKVIIWNQTTRNSLLLHQGDNYPRDGSSNNLPLSTIKQYFTFKLKIF